jgi:hypothetical protein
MPTHISKLFWGIALGGLAWNVFGIVQYLASVNATPASLIAGGMAPEQAAVMTGYPAWMTGAFAIGVFAGTIGSILMLLRKKIAVPVFLISLIAYIVLYIGDITQGVFAAMGMPQVIILSMVVAIAFALWFYSRRSAAAGVLN